MKITLSSRGSAALARTAALGLYLLATALYAHAGSTKTSTGKMKGGPYPPRLPGRQDVLTFTENGLTVDFIYYPRQINAGKLWSGWGDSLCANGKYYSSFCDHEWNAYIYEYDPETKKMRLLVDLRKVINMPDGKYTPGKIHSRLDIGSDGWIYFSTHRGSTRTTNDAYQYKGDWILRVNPETAKTEVLAHGLLKDVFPASQLDPERLIFYTTGQMSNTFLAYDVKKRQVIKRLNGQGFNRYAAFSSSTGLLYWKGHKYDPATNTISSSGCPAVRAATKETPDGFIYGVTKGSTNMWRLNVKTGTVTNLGKCTVGGQSYITTLDVDPTGRYVYYSAGAHGGSQADGTPIVRFDVQTRKPSVVVKLHPAIQKRCGYVPIGTFGSDVSEDGSKLYFTWNGSTKKVSKNNYSFDLMALTVVHLPEGRR